MAPARREPDTGWATLEIAILGPVLLLIVFTLVQTALWYYARSLAPPGQQPFAQFRQLGCLDGVACPLTPAKQAAAALGQAFEQIAQKGGTALALLGLGHHGCFLGALPG